MLLWVTVMSMLCLCAHTGYATVVVITIVICVITIVICVVDIGSIFSVYGW